MRTRTVDLNPSGRDLVVGDVHGCFRTLNRALREVGFDPECDRLFVCVRPSRPCEEVAGRSRLGGW